MAIAKTFYNSVSSLSLSLAFVCSSFCFSQCLSSFVSLCVRLIVAEIPVSISLPRLAYRNHNLNWVRRVKTRKIISIDDRLVSFDLYGFAFVCWNRSALAYSIMMRSGILGSIDQWSRTTVTDSKCSGFEIPDFQNQTSFRPLFFVI